METDLVIGEGASGELTDFRYYKQGFRGERASLVIPSSYFALFLLCVALNSTISI